MECDVFDTIAMLHQMVTNNGVIWLIGGHKHEKYFILAHDMTSKFTAACFQALIGKRLKTHTGYIVAGGLLRIANVER